MAAETSNRKLIRFKNGFVTHVICCLANQLLKSVGNERLDTVTLNSVDGLLN